MNINGTATRDVVTGGFGSEKVEVHVNDRLADPTNVTAAVVTAPRRAAGLGSGVSARDNITKLTTVSGGGAPAVRTGLNLAAVPLYDNADTIVRFGRLASGFRG